MCCWRKANLKVYLHSGSNTKSTPSNKSKARTSTTFWTWRCHSRKGTWLPNCRLHDGYEKTRTRLDFRQKIIMLKTSNLLSTKSSPHTWGVGVAAIQLKPERYEVLLHKCSLWFSLDRSKPFLTSSQDSSPLEWVERGAELPLILLWTVLLGTHELFPQCNSFYTG